MSFDYQKNWTCVHAEIFNEFVEFMNNANEKYFILRNYEMLPKKNNSKDVDIIIDPKNYQHIMSVLLQILQQHGFSYIFRTDFEKVHCLYAVDWKNHLSIHVDLIAGYSHKGCEIFSLQTLFSKTKRYKNFMVLQPDFDTVLLFYYKLFAAKKIIIKYQVKIYEGLKQYSQYCLALFCLVSGKYIGKRIFYLLQKNDYDAIHRLYYPILLTAKMRAWLKTPLRTSKQYLYFIWKKFYRICICPVKYRKFIAIAVDDDARKAEFIKRIEEELNFFFVSEDKCRIYSHRPGVLVDLKHSDDIKITGGKKNISGIKIIASCLKYAGKIFFVMRKCVQFDLFIILNQGMDDFFIDSKLFGLNMPNWLQKIVAGIIPRPRLFFILTDQQKNTEIQIKKCELLAKHNDEIVVFDKRLTVDEMVKQTSKIILNKFATYK